MEKKKISWREIVWYSVSGLLAAFGISLIITHIVGAYKDSLLEDNAVYQAENNLISALNINVNFMGWGFIILVVALFMAVLVLYHYAKKDDAIKERDAKRKARLADQLKEMEAASEETKPVETKDVASVVEVEPTVEKKAE